VILTTHDLADVHKLCRRVLIIDRGRLLYDGSLDDLQARFGGKRELVVDFSEPYENVSIAGADVWRRENGQTVYRFDREVITASELIGRLSQRYRIRDLSVREPDVEATVRRIYTDRLLETAETAIAEGKTLEEEDGR
jgi:ABC-2 type transport system ATP-binding protein